jgi:hypothetical protein
VQIQRTILNHATHAGKPGRPRGKPQCKHKVK